MTPRVTVLSSVYKDAPFVRQAVESILAQTYTDFEYLIINDACVDESRAIVASYDDPRIRIVDNETNLGLANSLNRGLALARGEYIARFDSNDVCFPERLAKQVAFLDAQPEVAAVGVQSAVIDVFGRRIRRAEQRWPVSDVGIRWCLIFSTPIVHSATMYRRSVVFQELGGYDTSYRVSEDSELWHRVSVRHRLGNLDEQLMAVRFDPLSISGDLANPIRSDATERWDPVLRDAMKRHLQMDVPEEWPRLWQRVNHPGARVSAGEIRRFVRMVDDCFERFAMLNAGARTDRDVRSHRAILLGRALEKMALVDRIASLRIFGRICADDRRAAAALLPKYGIAMVGGELPIRIWRRWKRRLAISASRTR